MFKRFRLYFITGLLLVLNSISAVAQKSAIELEIRPRTEFRNGYKSLMLKDVEAAIFTDQRSRLIAYHQNSGMKTKLVVQDIRVWGNQPQLVGNQRLSLSVHEAWGEAIFSNKWSLRLGRQELTYDDDRIMGSVNWAQQARSHDLGLLMFKDSLNTLHTGFAFNQAKARLNNTLYDISNNYKTMQFVWFNSKKIKHFNLSLLFLNLGIQFTDISFSSDRTTHFNQTFGTHLEYKNNKFYADLNAFMQTGNDASSLQGRKLSAHLFNINLGYKPTSKTNVTLGHELISGNDETAFGANSVNKAFNPVFGTNHKFNGLMDYFYVGNHLNSVGLNDTYLKFKYKVDTRWVALHLHNFIAAGEVLDDQLYRNTDIVGATSSNLGYELDLIAGMPVSQGVKLQFGYSQLLPTASMSDLKNSLDPYTNQDIKSGYQAWAWIMIQFKPTLYSKN